MATEHRKAQMREARRKWAKNNPERHRANVARWRAANLERDRANARASHYRRKYGITPEDYDRMLAEQGGLCAICGTDDPRGMGRFHVDHDHKSTIVRGLLCSGCNAALGSLEEYLEQAQVYVRRGLVSLAEALEAEAVGAGAVTDNS